MTNSIYYKRITGSSIQGNGYTVTEPLGTLVINDAGQLRVHDGTTAGGNPVGGGGGNGTSLINGSYSVSLSSSTGILSLSTASIILGSGTDPNVYIETVSSETTSIWTFGTNGVLTLPAATPVIKGSGTGTDVTVIAQNTSTTSTWVFSADGTLTLPANVVGNSVLYSAQHSLQLYNNNSTGTVAIRSKNGDGDSLWAFAGNGSLTLPQGVTLGDYPVFGPAASTAALSGEQVYLTSPNGAAWVGVENGDPQIGNNIPGLVTGIDNWNGQGGWNQGSYINTSTTGGSGTGLTVNVAGGGGYININAITINNPGTGYTVGDVITINNENNLTGQFTITAVTDTTNVWTFSNTGKLTLPGAVQGRVAANTCTSTTIELDVHATINKLTPIGNTDLDHYHLADGVEGQIMYITAATGAPAGETTLMSFDHARYTNGTGNITEGTNVTGWMPWRGGANVTPATIPLLFIDGYWNLSHSNFI